VKNDFVKFQAQLSLVSGRAGGTAKINAKKFGRGDGCSTDWRGRYRSRLGIDVNEGLMGREPYHHLLLLGLQEVGLVPVHVPIDNTREHSLAQPAHATGEAAIRITDGTENPSPPLAYPAR
jgi:hypothetical protein